MAIPANAVQIQGAGVVNADEANTFVQAVTNLSALRTFTGLSDMMIYLQGYNTPGDGGQAPYYYNSAATGPDNGSTVIVPTGAIQGAWIRLPTSVLGLLIYAALPTGPTDTWNPTGYTSQVDAIVITTVSGGSTLEGLVGGVSDRRIILANAGVDVLIIEHAGSGTAIYNFYCPNSTNLSIPVNGAAEFVYDAVLPGWRAIELGTPLTRSIQYVVDGGGAVLTTGIKGDLDLPFSCTLTDCVLLADEVGTLSADIWIAPLASYPPTVSNSIIPTYATLTAQDHATQDITGWTTAFSAGSTIRYNIFSTGGSIQRLTIAMTVISS